MTKSQFVNVIVRLIGVIFLAYAAMALLSVIGGLVVLSSSPSGSSLVSTLLTDGLFRILAGLIVGMYLIIDGQLLFSILDRED